MRRYRLFPASLILPAAALCAPGLAQSGGAPALSERQAALLQANCVQCHARRGTGAPQMGDAQAWKERARAGEERMLASVVLGGNGMPPLGYCGACNEQDLRALIRFMAMPRQ
jgi:cytochrome c5